MRSTVSSKLKCVESIIRASGARASGETSRVESISSRLLKDCATFSTPCTEFSSASRLAARAVKSAVK